MRHNLPTGRLVRDRCSEIWEPVEGRCLNGGVRESLRGLFFFRVEHLLMCFLLMWNCQQKLEAPDSLQPVSRERKKGDNHLFVVQNESLCPLAVVLNLCSVRGPFLHRDANCCIICKLNDTVVNQDDIIKQQLTVLGSWINFETAVSLEGDRLGLKMF